MSVDKAQYDLEKMKRELGEFLAAKNGVQPEPAKVQNASDYDEASGFNFTAPKPPSAVKEEVKATITPKAEVSATTVPWLVMPSYTALLEEVNGYNQHLESHVAPIFMNYEVHPKAETYAEELKTVCKQVEDTYLTSHVLRSLPIELATTKLNFFATEDLEHKGYLAPFVLFGKSGTLLNQDFQKVGTYELSLRMTNKVIYDDVEQSGAIHGLAALAQDSTKNDNQT